VPFKLEFDVEAGRAATSSSSASESSESPIEKFGLAISSECPRMGSGDSMDSRLAHRDVEELAEREAGLEEAASPIGEASRAWVEEEYPPAATARRWVQVPSPLACRSSSNSTSRPAERHASGLGTWTQRRAVAAGG
jgi:hypothetical protein